MTARAGGLAAGSLAGAAAAGLLAAAGLPGCGHRVAAPDPDLVQAESWAPPALAGAIVDGRFVDARLGMSVPVPEGWRAEPGRVDDATRVVLVEPVGGVRLRVVLGADEWPPARADCSWEFEDAGSYTYGSVTARLATCTPHDPGAPRILGWRVDAWRAGGPPLLVEAEVPPGQLVTAEEAAAGVLAGVR